MESTPAASSACAIWRIWSTEYWCRTAWLPSRNVTSDMYSFFISGNTRSLGNACGDPKSGGHGRACHDVQVASVGRQVVGCALDFQKHRCLEAAELACSGNFQRCIDHVELHLLLEPVARHIRLNILDHAVH